MFEYLAEYIEEKEFTESGKKHSFYRVNKKDINDAENKMKMKFPKELQEFFEEIGYGYFYDKDECFIDVLMKPMDIADYRCAEGMYVYAEDREFLDDDAFVFFEVDSNCHIHIKISGVNRGKIFFGRTEIASDFYEFIERLSEDSNYYMSL